MDPEEIIERVIKYGQDIANAAKQNEDVKLLVVKYLKLIDKGITEYLSTGKKVKIEYKEQDL